MRAVLGRVLAFLAILTVLTTLVVGFGWWSLHTGWFASMVRYRVVSALQRASGGQVEIGSFSFDPNSLHARLSNLVLRGTESRSSPALLSIAKVDVGLKILSVWRQEVDVESVLIGKPQIHLLINSDGTSNIPIPKKPSKKQPVEQLLDLKAKRIEVDQGLLEINSRSVPFAFQSDGIQLALNYNYVRPSYGVFLNTRATNISFAGTRLQPMRISSKGRLFADHAIIENLKLITDKQSSTLELSAEIEHFGHLLIHANVHGLLSVDELARLALINANLRSGQLGVTGKGEFSADSNKFVFRGNAVAHGVEFTSPAFTLRDISGNAAILADNGGMLLRDAHASAGGAHFAGSGFIKGYQHLEVDGQISDVALSQVGSYLTTQPFPWSGTAHGQAHATATFSYVRPEFNIGAKLQIEAAAGLIPTSGFVDVMYGFPLNTVQFGECKLNLPHSDANFQGDLNSALLLKAESTDLTDIQPLNPILGAKLNTADLPVFSSGGGSKFDGQLQTLSRHPVINGVLSLNRFKFHNYSYDLLSGHLSLSPDQLEVSKITMQESGADLNGDASIDLRNWLASADSPLLLNAHFTNFDFVKTVALFTAARLPIIQGLASGGVNLKGSLNNPRGTGTIQISNLDAFGEQLSRIRFDAALDGNRLHLSNGKVLSGQAMLNFSAGFQHDPGNWLTGDMELKADTNGFPLSALSTIRRYVPYLNGRAELHLDAQGKLAADSFEPERMNGSAQFQRLSIRGRELGNVSLSAVTQGNAIYFKYAGDLRDTKFHGAAQAHLTNGTPVRGELQMDRISLATLKSLVSETDLTFPLNGFLDGSIAFEGLLEEPARMHAQANISNLQISSPPRAVGNAAAAPDLVLANNEPILIDISDEAANIARFEIDGRDTRVKLTGTIPFNSEKPLNVTAIGSADLALFMLFDPNVRSSGKSELAANISGSMASPSVTGTLKVINGSFFLADVPNGLSDVDGTVLFGRNRATIQKMTAHSGGGDISLGGSLSFGNGNPLVYHLEAAARNVRVRYASSISVTGNGDLRLTGTSASSLLSGTLTVTRVVFTPNADAGNLLAAVSSSSASSINPEDFVSGLHFDVGVESAPNLQVSTNLSRDVEAEIALQIRGTPEHPIVLGNIAANQGDLKIFGTRLTLNRGEVNFVNSVHVEPVLDLDLQTQTRGVTVDITVSGTPSKLNFNYRSDPPLQPRDIIALLTVGRAPNVGTGNNSSSSDVGALTSGVSSVLGQAISPVSNRLSKLFGIANIKIDPFVQGITNTPQARLSVEQQISRDVTVTYVTNLSETSEQIFRFEWALNPQFSIVALRDDNGEFGIDFQYKKRFK